MTLLAYHRVDIDLAAIVSEEVRAFRLIARHFAIFLAGRDGAIGDLRRTFEFQAFGLSQ